MAKRVFLGRFLLYLILNIGVVTLLFLSQLLNVSSPMLFSYRLNRALSAICAGAIIGFSGIVLQATLRNPLVDHYVLGIGGGALVFSLLALILAGPNMLAILSTAVLGGLLALSITVFVAEKTGGSALSYVLSGLGVNSLFSGASFLLSFIASRQYRYAPFLLAGSFTSSSGLTAKIVIIAMMFSVATYFALAKPLNAIIVSDEHAYNSGYNPRVIRLVAVIVAGSSASIVVGLFGLIGFVGLATPHIARFLLRTSDHRFTMPLAMTAGSLITYITDLLSKDLFTLFLHEVPAGAIASLIGAPFFIAIYLRRYSGGRS